MLIGEQISTLSEVMWVPVQKERGETLSVVIGNRRLGGDECAASKSGGKYSELKGGDE